MQRFFYLFLLICSSILDSYAQTLTKERLRAVEIFTDWPIFLPGAEIEDAKRKTYLIFSDHYWILKESYKKWEADFSKVGPDGELDKKFIGREYFYYVGRRGSDFGLAYNPPVLDTPFTQIKIDSAINNFLSIPSKYYPFTTDQKNTISIHRDQKNGTVIEKTKFINGSYMAPDSVNFYYRKDPLAISFINSSIHIFDMTLFKCEALFFEKKIMNGLISPKRKWVFEIKEIEVPEREMALKMIEQFKKDSAKMLGRK